MTEMRLQKAMAHAGVASRRASEELILKGLVKVNGKVVTELGTKIDPGSDKLEVKGRPIQVDTDKLYLAFNKPLGVISSMKDDEGRQDLSKFFSEYERVFNVGRLDADTSGLLLMTNDGELSNQLTHPSFEVPKVYVARVQGTVQQSTVSKLLEGIELEDGAISADKAKLIDSGNQMSLVEITIHSGKNRIVRRMLDEVGHPVKDLIRQQFGPIKLGTLRPGDARELGKLEVSALIEATSKKD